MPDRASTYSFPRTSLTPAYSSARPMLGLARAPVRPRSFGLLGTYPPTLCGIATFTRALLRSIAAAAPDDRVGVVRVLDAPQEQPPAPAQPMRRTARSVCMAVRC